MLKEFSDYDYSEVSRLLDEAGKVAPSWSGSWLGYHSCVYYNNLETPPAGAISARNGGCTVDMIILVWGALVTGSSMLSKI